MLFTGKWIATRLPRRDSRQLQKISGHAAPPDLIDGPKRLAVERLGEEL